MVDLSGCTFMDSTALAILVEASRRLDGANGRLTIIAAAPAILRPFQITGLDRLFVFYPTRMAALSGESR
jgi:anti-anti-sigma factor